MGMCPIRDAYPHPLMEEANISGSVSHMQVLFNTDRYRRTLVASGVEEKQAEAMTDALSDAIGESVATKADIALLTADIDKVGRKIDLVEKSMQATLYKVVAAQTLVLVGAMAAIVFAAIKAIHPS